MAAPNEPSDLYNRTKRNLVVVIGVLAVVLLGFIDSDDKPNVAGIHLAPKAIPTVLFFATVYLVYQYWLAWSFQPEAVQKQIRVEFYATFVGAGAVIPRLLGAPTIGHRSYSLGDYGHRFKAKGAE